MANRKRLIFLTLVLLLLLSTSCAASPTGNETSATSAGTTAPVSTSSQTTQTTDLNGRPDAASGILRLWWSKRGSLNPLLDRSQSGQAVNQLIFQGLFSIDSTQKYQFQLARDIRFTANGKQVMIDLAPDVVFHDGSKLTAADVVACINFILSNPDQSDYSQSLQVIQSVTTIGPSTIRLTLTQPDPWLPYALTFPVLTAASLSLGPFDLVPGSGPFRMQSYDAENGLTLKKVSLTGDDSEMTTVSLTEFNNLAEAMRAFENDAIDLVNLTAAEYSRYMLRNSLRFEQYTGNQLLFLAYNTQEKKLLADSSRLTFLKQLLNPVAFSEAGAADWGESTCLPLAATTWTIREAKIRQVLDTLGKPAWDATDKKLRVLVLADDSFQQQAMGLVCGLLDRAGVAWQLESLAAADYWAALAEGAYDLTIMDAVLPVQPDPSWLYRDDRPGRYGVLSSLAGKGLDEYDLWRQKLVLSLSPVNCEMLPSGQDYADTLAETAARAPWSILVLRSGAILYGDRVIGQCQPDQNNPFKGIEELWIWSGE